MASSKQTTSLADTPITTRMPPNHNRTASSLAPSMLTLARWRWRRQWFLLLITGLGIVAAIMMICLVPLLSNITTTAGLRDLLTNNPNSAQIQLNLETIGTSTAELDALNQQFSPIFQQHLQQYLATTPLLTMQLQNIPFAATQQQGNQVNIYSEEMSLAQRHATILQGTLPTDTANSSNGSTLEAAITTQTASTLHLTVGSVLPLNLSFYTNANYDSKAVPASSVVPVHIVGIFNPTTNDTFWQGQQYQPQHEDQWTIYGMLVSNRGLLHTMDALGRAHQVSIIFPTQGYTVNLVYRLNPAHISNAQLSDLIGQLNVVQSIINTKYISQEDSTYQPTSSPYLRQVGLSGAVLDTLTTQGILTQYLNKVALMQVPVSILLIQIAALILFFVAVMADILVERQLDELVVLRSRGASGLQVAGSLLIQGIVLSLLAVIIALPLTVLLALLVAHLVLPAAQQGAIDVVSSQPVQAMLSVIDYALLGALIAVLTMALGLNRVARLNVLATRREAARSTRSPLWLRLNLDLVAAVVALLGYGLSLYVTNLGGLVDAQTRSLIDTPLTLLAPLFLLIALILLMLRLFPLLLRMIAAFAARGRGAPPMLALAQMARSPQQALRMTLLLALAIAFALFTLVFTATQAQRTSDIAAYESGADFSGDIAVLNSTRSLADTVAAYQHLTGVQAASAGYTVTGASTNSSINVPMLVQAVDPASFAQTAIWTSQDSTQSLSSLMQLLVTQRTVGMQQGFVPVIIDQSTQISLDLHVGSTFAMNVDNPGDGQFHGLVIAIVMHIPSVSDAVNVSSSSNNPSQGGILADYQTYNAVYMHDLSTQKVIATPLPINHAWLRSSSDATQLATLRHTLNTSDLRLTNLLDRRAILDTMHSDALYLNLLGILSLGATAALLLALVGSLLASWLNVRLRLTNFAVLRALGTSPRQIASVLVWEQIVVYATSLVLGAIMGLLLVFTVVPALVFNSVPVQSSQADSGALYHLQQIIPVHIVFSFSLVFALLTLIILCVAALGLMIRVVSRPALSQALRLNED